MELQVEAGMACLRICNIYTEKQVSWLFLKANLISIQ